MIRPTSWLAAHQDVGCQVLPHPADPWLQCPTHLGGDHPGCGDVGRPRQHHTGRQLGHPGRRIGRASEQGTLGSCRPDRDCLVADPPVNSTRRRSAALGGNTDRSAPGLRRSRGWRGVRSMIGKPAITAPIVDAKAGALLTETLNGSKAQLTQVSTAQMDQSSDRKGEAP
jgi:hypothetical protein